MTFKNIIYLLKIFILKRILKKDTMDIEMKRYIEKGVKIGKNMRAFSPPISKEPYLLEFGDNITISTGVKFTTHDNSIIKIVDNATDIFGRIKIGDNCFIGQNATILPGVEISNNIIVAAGSVVTKSFTQEGIIIGGNPAKIIGTFQQYSAKYKDNAFNIRGLNSNQIKALILENEKRLIKK
jgi:acetyltransferase-like isoleucine patch superfamily enzyme